MIITISGTPGSGKNTLAEGLSAKYSWEHRSIGNWIGKLAREKENKNVNDFVSGELNSVDEIVDNWLRERNEQGGNYIIDSRTAFHFIPNSIKIYLYVSPETGAERIFKDQRSDEMKYNSVEELITTNNKRIANEKKRYQKYVEDCHNQDHYDLIIDTTNLTIEEVKQQVIDFMNQKQDE